MEAVHGVSELLCMSSSYLLICAGVTVCSQFTARPETNGEQYPIVLCYTAYASGYLTFHAVKYSIEEKCYF